MVSRDLTLARAWKQPFVEIGGGGCVVVDDHLHIYFNESDRSAYLLGASVARAPLAAVFAAAAEGRAAPFAKYHEGSWSEPGLGGRSTAVVPSTLGSVIWPDVVRLVDTQEYLMVFELHDLQPAVPMSALMVATSPDGLRWDVDGYVALTEGERIYPTLMGPDLRRHKEVVGTDVFVFEVLSPDIRHRWNDATLVRNTIRDVSRSS